MDINEEFRLWYESLGYHGTQEAFEAYQAGRRAGEESMRERAAKVCVDTGGMTAEDCADAIRALPIGGE